MIVFNDIGFDFEGGYRDADWPEWEQIAEATIGEYFYGDNPWL